MKDKDPGSLGWSRRVRTKGGGVKTGWGDAARGSEHPAEKAVICKKGEASAGL